MSQYLCTGGKQDCPNYSGTPNTPCQMCARDIPAIAEPDEERSLTVCTLCGQDCKTRAGLKSHVTAKHSETEE